jgi:molybdenum cofactor cytidylyltransferase
LGDQPALESSVVDAVIAAYCAGLGNVVIPSFQMRRGHPILIDRTYWKTILELEGRTLRDFMRDIGTQIYHVPVSTSSILRDMDTPGEYQRELADYVRRQIEPAYSL